MKCSNCGSSLELDSKFCASCGSEIVNNQKSSFARPPVEYQGPKKLYRSQRERMIAGVCGGIAEYMDLDPTLVRIIFVLITLLGGSGILLYIILLIVIPENPLEPWAQPGNMAYT